MCLLRDASLVSFIADGVFYVAKGIEVTDQSLKVILRIQETLGIALYSVSPTMNAVILAAKERQAYLYDLG